MPYAASFLAILVAICAAYFFTSTPLRAEADVTAVLLNWARLPNVVQIVSVLCQVDVIKQVVVWNNAARSPQDFANGTCSPQQLSIHNSPENLYFQARFIACANASTPYCFIQLYAVFGRESPHMTYFSFPPTEVLSSHLLSISSPSTNVTFGFSWLGYGSLVLRSHARSFLSLLARIGASEEELKMADNYYTILKNSVPEVWTGHPTPLGGGSDFTVGEEGAARNRKHIAAAVNYLDKIVAQSGSGEWPYVTSASSYPGPPLERSPCLKRACILESTIQLSPSLTPEFIANHTLFSLSRAVDADHTTSFRSPHNAAEGDILTLDNLDRMPLAGVEWVWEVDTRTAMLLRASPCSFSSDKSTWVISAFILAAFR
ncbi:hypothetical protein C8R46DRAFT_1073418 [Mycena filopes]|nr:hypothetical protein C8R46DRAFT_1073418 [Mycena filopes]